MIKYILIPILCLFGVTSVFGQSEVKEAYFHELRGMEDSSGVTHLFYRMYKKSEGQCSDDNGGQTLISWSDNIYHFNTELKSDSIKFTDYNSPWCLDGVYSSQGVNDYDFYNNDPNKWLISTSYEYLHWVEDYSGKTLTFEVPIAVKQTKNSPIQDYFPIEFYLSPIQDSLFMDSDGTTIPFPGDSENWPEFIDHEDFLNYADSLSFPLEMLGISPEIDSAYFAKDAQGHLYRSTNYSSGLELADSSGAFTKLAFDADPSVIYSLITIRENSEYNRKLIISDDLGSQSSWTVLSIPETNSLFEFLETDDSVDGTFFLADSNTVYASSDFGVNFSEIISSEDLITGLYKKPDSDILYVLTREELLEVNTETKETVSLKKIPVSNEPELSEVPNQISLEQNYPNPFNPSTLISYQLNSDQLVRLEVFDVTGRKVAILVDGERKPAGAHQVTFEASGLSSGVYFYRLEAGGQTITQKMLLMK